MRRLVEKVNLPFYGVMYVTCSEDVSIETMQALQEPLKKLYEYEEEEQKFEGMDCGCSLIKYCMFKELCKSIQNDRNVKSIKKKKKK